MIEPSSSESPGNLEPTGPVSSQREARRTDRAVLTIDEAASLLRVNRKTLYQAVKLGKVPGVVRLGRVIRLSRTALVHWMDGNGGPALGE
jgi:excisionase family DNA binding protein